MKLIPFAVLLTLVFLQGCGGEPDFIDRQAYVTRVEVVYPADSDSGRGEIHLQLISNENERKVHLRLDVGEEVHIESETFIVDPPTTVLVLEGSDAEYRFPHRDLFERAAEFEGKFIPIENYRDSKG